MSKILSILVLLVAVPLTACTSTRYVNHTEFVVLAPEPLDTPDPPVLIPYRVSEPLTSEYNFKTLQVNHLQMIDYITLLHRNLKYYELQLNELNKRKEDIEKSKSSQQ